MHRLAVSTLGIWLWLASAGLAQGTTRGRSHFDGIQLSPTAHGGGTMAHLSAGTGVDLSLNRWLDIEGWVSGVGRPLIDRDIKSYPGAASVGVAVQSRLAGTMHAFVYGAGLTYISAFHCPRGCALGPAIVFEEDRSVIDMYAAQLRLGYEVRTNSHWWFRSFWTFDAPFAFNRVLGPAEGFRYRASPADFMHLSLVLTVGYAFAL